MFYRYQYRRSGSPHPIWIQQGAVAPLCFSASYPVTIGDVVWAEGSTAIEIVTATATTTALILGWSLTNILAAADASTSTLFPLEGFILPGQDEVWVEMPFWTASTNVPTVGSDYDLVGSTGAQCVNMDATSYNHVTCMALGTDWTNQISSSYPQGAPIGKTAIYATTSNGAPHAKHTAWFKITAAQRHPLAG